MTNQLVSPRSIADQFCIDGWTYSASDGDAIGLDNDDNPDLFNVWIDFDEDDPTYYSIEGHLCESVEEVHDVLRDIVDNPEMYL